MCSLDSVWCACYLPHNIGIVMFNGGSAMHTMPKYTSQPNTGCNGCTVLDYMSPYTSSRGCICCYLST